MCTLGTILNLRGTQPAILLYKPKVQLQVHLLLANSLHEGLRRGSLHTMSNSANKGMEEKKDSLAPLDTAANSSSSENSEPRPSIFDRMKRMPCFPRATTFHLYLWGAANTALVIYLVFSFSLMTEKNANGAVSLALWVLTMAGILYALLGTLAISSSMRSRFTFGAVVGSSAFLSSQMFLVSIIAGGDLAVNDDDDKMDSTERGVSIFSLLLSFLYIALSIAMWLNRKAILKGWKMRQKLPVNSHLAGEFDEIELI